MPSITVYTRKYCGFCTAAINLLNETPYEFDVIAVDDDPALRTELEQRSGQSTLPQIFVGDHSVGGYQELALAIAEGEFDELLLNHVG
jgi:glutaredoxin 3